MQQRQVSHEAPVTGALYNSLFNVVVSACQASTIICWNIENGEKVIQFKNAHSQISGGFVVFLSAYCITLSEPVAFM